MSYQAGSTCVETPLQANQYTAAQSKGQLITIGTTTYATDVTSVTGSGIVYLLSDISSSATISRTVPATPIDCSLLDTADGIVLIWLVVAMWIAASQWNVIKSVVLQLGNEK